MLTIVDLGVDLRATKPQNNLIQKNLKLVKHDSEPEDDLSKGVKEILTAYIRDRKELDKVLASISLLIGK